MSEPRPVAPVTRALDTLRGRLRDRRRRRLARTGSLGSGRVQLGLLAMLAVLVAVVVWSFAYLSPDPAGTERSIDELLALAEAGEVRTATFNDEDARIVGATADGRRLHVAYPRSDATTADLIETLAVSGARVDVDPQPAKSIVRVVLTVLLPLMLLADLFALFLVWSRGGSQGIGEVTTFGQVGDKQVTSASSVVGFADVAGVDEAVVELREVVDYLTDPTRYDELGAAPPKGVLLFGPPGVGKTLLAKAVAAEAGVPFFSVAGAEFVESLVGVGAARVRDLFARVRAVAPAIVFLDELDAAGRRRQAGGGGGGSDEREQTLNQLLVEMDGFEVSSGIVVVAATNRPDILDPALLRPGRFDRHITIERPDLQAREEILRLHAAKRRRVSTHVDFGELARRTPGFSGADLANAVNEAALLTIREGSTEIREDLFTEAIHRVMSGPKRRGHLMTDDEKRRIAVHESGHAVAAAVLGHAEDVHRLSIVARGRGLAFTATTDEDATVLSTDQLRRRLTVTLSGTAAEELLLGDVSTAGEDDVERASRLARDMVGRYGMSSLGKVRLLTDTGNAFLGDSEQVEHLSEQLHAAFDQAVTAIVDEAYADSTGVLERHRVEVDTLVEALLEHETLEEAAVRPLLPEAEPVPTTNGRSRRSTPRKEAPAKKAAS